MRIRLYGRLVDAIGRHVDVEAPDGCTVADIRGRLAAGHPHAAEALQRSRACLAGVLIGDDRPLGDHEELEFLPPVSGG